MKFKYFPFIFILSILSTSCFYIQEGEDPKIISNFTFGSNYYGRYTKNEDIFKIIHSHNPSLWIWLGNSVFLDKPRYDFWTNNLEENDWNFTKLLYQKAKNNKYYKEMSEQIPIIGTWGDEEYGVSNGDEGNQFKEGYKQNYLDFLDTDLFDFRRDYVKEGMYSTYSFGSGAKSFRIILLDLKYNKKSEKDKYDMLGEEQWLWLEKIIKERKETYTFIGMSNQFLQNDRLILKKWYKGSRLKLFELLGKYKKSGVIILSGGTGFSQILKTFCPFPDIGYNIYEFTSSGLGYTNKLQSFYNNLYHNDYLIEGTNYNEISFGQIRINWGEGNDITKSYINMEIFGENDNLVSNVTIKYEDLMYKDEKNYYLNEKNLEKIKYMNINDGESCKRELIEHRIRTAFMIMKYYLFNLKDLPIAIITTIIIIGLVELVVKKKIFVILIILFIILALYSGCYFIDLINYKNFVQMIKGN